jgi:hypothetical protein
MDNLNKQQLEAELLLVQKKKVEAEIEVLKKTTPVTEGIKTFGSLILGIGGVVVAIFGFQLAEVKAEKFKLEADKANIAKDTAQKEVLRLTQSRDRIKAEVKDLEDIIAQHTKTLEQLSDKIPSDKGVSKPGSVLENIRQDINAAAIELRASSTAAQPAGTTKPMSTLIEELYSPKAFIRGAAYNQLMTNYANRPELVPALLDYSYKHLDNANGIYNSLVVLSRIDYKKVPRDVQAVRAFANRTKNNGPNTADRVKKLLERIS